MSSRAPHTAVSARVPLASVSVDLDPLWCYYAIHGLTPAGASAFGQGPPQELADVVLRRALPRFLSLFARHGLRGTFFVVGSDGERELGRARLRAAARAGHELANHSHRHPYDLSRQGAAAVAEELSRCDQVLREILSEALDPAGGEAAPAGLLRAPRGFRSPGYDLTAVQLTAAADLGYRYDSSLFPCPIYYAAKAAVMLGLRLAGRPSRSVLTSPLLQVAPALPYRPDLQRPFRRGQAPLIELPVAVTPWLRLPAIGGSLLVSEPLRRHLLAAMRPRPFFNLELHGMDLIDAEEDDIPTALLLRQPELRVPLSARLAALDDTLAQLCAEREVLPLYQVADHHAREGWP